MRFTIKTVLSQKYDLTAITVDLGLGNLDLDPIRELCKEFEIPYYVLPTEIGTVLFDIRKESNPCSLCAKNAQRRLK